jgi:hypothetical protein
MELRRVTDWPVGMAATIGESIRNFRFYRGTGHGGNDRADRA